MFQDVIDADKKQVIALKLKDVLDQKKKLEEELAWTKVSVNF